jgi:hypothetical protein
MITCANCDHAAREWVTYVARSTRQAKGDPVPMCARHVQQELTLGAANLSMVDVELTPIDRIERLR